MPGGRLLYRLDTDADKDYMIYVEKDMPRKPEISTSDISKLFIPSKF